MSLSLRPLLAAALAVTTTLALVLSLGVVTAGADARDISSACPGEPEPAPYADRDRIPDPHRTAVDCLTQLGVVEGTRDEDGRWWYRPGQQVPRGQMATFILRLLEVEGGELPPAGDQGYEDVDDDHAHAEAIRKLSDIGVVEGVGEGRYEPDRLVTRAQMATFLIRAAAYQAGVEADDLRGGETPFADVRSGSTHGPSIEGIYELGITEGIAEDRYAPEGTVRRDEMASFVARTLDAMVSRTTVADRDGGALPHTVFTWLEDTGRCLQVKAGTTWMAHCAPEASDPLQIREVRIDDGFTVIAGLATTDVSSVVVEHEPSPGAREEIELELVGTRSETVVAWASPLLRTELDAVVAYEGEREVARTSFGEGSGDPVSVTDVRVAHHDGFDRVVFDLVGDGLPGWRVEYVDQAREQGSGHAIELEGEATLRLLLDHVQYPPHEDRVENGTRFDGADLVREVYASNVYEARSLFFAGVAERAAFEVTALDDPPRLVLDVHHAGG